MEKVLLCSYLSYALVLFSKGAQGKVGFYIFSISPKNAHTLMLFIHSSAYLVLFLFYLQARVAAAQQKVGVPSITVKQRTHGFLPLFVAQFFLLLATLGAGAVLFVLPESQLKEAQDVSTGLKGVRSII